MQLMIIKYLPSSVSSKRRCRICVIDPFSSFMLNLLQAQRYELILLKKLPGSFASKFTVDNHSFDTLLATYKSSSEVKATTGEPTSQLKSFTLGHHIYGSLHLHLPQKCATTSCTIWALQNACCIHV